MINITDKLFLGGKGKAIYEDAKRAVEDYSMLEKMQGGVIVGFSGGADSLMLLLFLLEFRKNNGNFPLLAVHINHMIRGEEADSDEHFAREVAQSLGVPFASFRIDVPEIALKHKIGTEEAARNVRYDKFRELLSMNGYSVIAVAHNATDNLETAIINMMRGAGTAGVAGILPVRDNIIRPLIYIPKSDIVDALEQSNIEYKVDSTNSSVEYTRNYVRHKIIPSFERLSKNPERMATRMSRNLREDSDFIDSVAADFYKENSVDGVFSSEGLAKLSGALLRRVLTAMVTDFHKEKNPPLPERTHVDAIASLLSGGDFRYSLPGGIRFVSLGKRAFIEEDLNEVDTSFCFAVSEGVNRFDSFSSVILVSRNENFESYLNIYKISIKARITSAIIKGNLIVRSKNDGDSYFYGGINRKLKKLFNDRKIPISDRQRVPIFCDESGILWVPGFGIRDDGVSSDALYIAIAEPIETTKKTNASFYFKSR